MADSLPAEGGRGERSAADIGFPHIQVPHIPHHTPSQGITFLTTPTPSWRTKTSGKPGLVAQVYPSWLLMLRASLSLPQEFTYRGRRQCHRVGLWT